MQIASAFGIGATIVAAVATTVVYFVREQIFTADTIKVPADGIWKNVKAVEIEMDSGAELKLPITAHVSYTEGMRVKVFSLQDRNSSQLMALSHIPYPGDPIYANWCTRTLDDALAEATLKEKADLVQEDKIVE